MPLGSEVEKTKQEKASLKASPQGGLVIPPRQGQSQLISPVSGLNAADWSAGEGEDVADDEGAGGSGVVAAEGSRKMMVSFPESSCLV